MSNLVLHRITLVSNAHLTPLLALYVSAFPENERRKNEDFLAVLKNEKRFFCFAIFQNNVFCGMITLWELTDFYYCEHFAVVSEMRNANIGTETMQYVIKQGFTPILCEVDPPDDDIKKRRIAFYQRQNFILRDIPYIQPAYSADKQPIPMRLMTLDFPKTALKTAIEELKRVVYFRS